MQIKILHKQGKSVRAIACELGCSINTVRKYLQANSQPRYKERTKRASILAPFESYLREPSIGLVACRAVCYTTT